MSSASSKQQNAALNISATTQSIQTTGMPQGDVVANMCGFKFHKDASVEISIYADKPPKQHTLPALPMPAKHEDQCFATVYKKK
jgi:hypothetical protein